MSSSSWYRVARGLQMVAESAMSQTASAAGSTSTRYAEHATDLARNARVAAARASDATGGRSETWSNNVSNDDDALALSSESASVMAAAPISQQTSISQQTDTEEVSPADQLSEKTDYVQDVQRSSSDMVKPPDEDTAHVPHSVGTKSSSDSFKHIDDSPTLAEGRPVPSTRVGRALGFASLGVGLAAGTAVEAVSRLLSSSDGQSSMSEISSASSSQQQHSAVTSDANADRLAAHLCRMRGAALKLGQMLSMQDEAFLAPPLARALARVRGSADAMPRYQLDSVLSEELGSDWRDKLDKFEDLPFAAASIGQVHRAAVNMSDDDAETGLSSRVAMKVQYPGVADSIDSDLNNLTMLVKATKLAPPGLFIDEVIRVGREELKVECDYMREAENQTKFRELILSDDVLSGPECMLSVPRVIPELSTKRVLTTQFAPGGTIEKVSNLDQEERNRIGRAILRLTMRELFIWRFMQTDPNWGNFLYDVGTSTTHLVDHGAAREFSKSFVDGYLQIVKSSADRDADTLMDVSHDMGFLTGEENDIMLEAHKMSGFTVGEPFATDEPYDFGWSGISARLSGHSSAFLQHRLTPPPPEVYTLHRKLAGAYNLCIKLGAIIPCRDLLDEVSENYVFGDN